MYTAEDLGLGQTPPAETAPSLWDSFANVIGKGVSAGFNIYNRVQNIQAQRQQTNLANQQAQQIAAMYTYGTTQPTSGVPGVVAPGTIQMYRQSSMFDGWTIPLLVAGAATIGFVLLKRK